MERSIFAVVGGDARQIALANMLSAEGNTVYCAGFENAAQSLVGTASTDPLTAVLMADTIILPMPPTRDGVLLNAPLSTYRIRLDDEFCDALRGKAVFTGMAAKLREVSPGFAKLNLFDYYANESFLLRNARATAEGALAEMMIHSDRTICGSRVMITGCGRITRFLAPMLQHMGAHVAVVARKAKDWAWAESLGMESFSFKKAARRVKEFNLIVNTVPALVIHEKMADAMAPDTLVIDLASLPGGVDYDACARRGIKTVQALGLPGKYSPLTAAAIIKETVMLILEEG